MPHSHHSHSGQFCRHAAQGTTLEDVVQEAISKGFKVFGLSEHCPRYRKVDLYPEESDLNPEDLSVIFEAYLTEAHRLKAKYSSQINLLVGLETDYISPIDIEGIKSLRKKHGSSIQYIVGSLHHCNEIPIDFDKDTYLRSVSSTSTSTSTSSPPSSLSSFLTTYLDAQHILIQELKPEIIGHFDLCRLYTPNVRLDEDEEVWKRVERNIEAAVEYGALFEANAASFRKGWEEAYPGSEVLQLILRKGGRICLSDDSHGPAAVGLNYKKLKEYLTRQGVQEIWYLDDKGTEGGQVEAKRYEGNWAEDAFWERV